MAANTRTKIKNKTQIVRLSEEAELISDHLQMQELHAERSLTTSSHGPWGYAPYSSLTTSKYRSSKQKGLREPHHFSRSSRTRRPQMRPPKSFARHVKLLEAEDEGLEEVGGPDEGERSSGVRRIANIDNHFCKRLHFYGACKN
jgi:hypothetical protein